MFGWLSAGWFLCWLCCWMFFFFSVGRVGWVGLGLFFVVFCEMIDMMCCWDCFW